MTAPVGARLWQAARRCGSRLVSCPASDGSVGALLRRPRCRAVGHAGAGRRGRIGARRRAVRDRAGSRRPLLSVVVVLARRSAWARTRRAELTASRLSGFIAVGRRPAARRLVPVATRRGRRTARGRVAAGRSTTAGSPASASRRALPSEFLPLYREARARLRRQLAADRLHPPPGDGVLDRATHVPRAQRLRLLRRADAVQRHERARQHLGALPPGVPRRQAARRATRTARPPPSIYDDFDAIMAAGSLLRASGAGPSLGGASGRRPTRTTGTTSSASRTPARCSRARRRGSATASARTASRTPALVDEFDVAYGAAIREELLAEEEAQEGQRKKGKKGDRESAPSRRARPPPTARGAERDSPARRRARRARQRARRRRHPTRRRARRSGAAAADRRRRPPRRPPRRLPPRRRRRARACASCSAARWPARPRGAGAARAGRRAPAGARSG